MDNNSYFNKYNKYKQKYLNLKKILQKGGSAEGLGIEGVKQAIKDNDLQKHFLPYVIFTSFYGIVLGTLIGGEASNVNIHVHHAICASLLSLWFTDWNKKSSMILHGMLMGVTIEGINFYGIGELSLFLCNNGF